MNLLEGQMNLLEGRMNLLEGRMNLLEGRMNLLEGLWNLLEGQQNLLEPSPRIPASSRRTLALSEAYLDRPQDASRDILSPSNANLDSGGTKTATRGCDRDDVASRRAIFLPS